jgi:hypothetical protein
MHESAERRAGRSQSEVILHNQTNGLRSVNWLARGPLDLYMHCAPSPVGYPPIPSFGGFGYVRVFSFGLIFYYYYFEYDLTFNLNLSD